MDARIGDWAVTPRHGKAVEINALWFNALAILAELAARFGEKTLAADLEGRASKVKRAFAATFWNASDRCLYDVVRDGERDASIRPNQLLAISLPHPLLGPTRARQVLDIVEAKLLTPVGLRSLAPDHPDYRPVYRGGAVERDSAYHQGTVWSWLMGPYLSAVVRYRGEAGRREARKLIAGLAPHLGEAGLGQISEIFDAEPPHAPRGAIAQAWSVGEILRAYVQDVMAAPVPAGAGKSPAKKATEKTAPKVAPKTASKTVRKGKTEPAKKAAGKANPERGTTTKTTTKKKKTTNRKQGPARKTAVKKPRAKKKPVKAARPPASSAGTKTKKTKKKTRPVGKTARKKKTAAKKRSPGGTSAARKRKKARTASAGKSGLGKKRA